MDLVANDGLYFLARCKVAVDFCVVFGVLASPRVRKQWFSGGGSTFPAKLRGFEKGQTEV